MTCTIPVMLIIFSYLFLCSGIQTTQGSFVTDNIIIGTSHYAGIGILANQGTPAAVQIVGNTIFNGTAASVYVSGYEDNRPYIHFCNL